MKRTAILTAFVAGATYAAYTPVPAEDIGSMLIGRFKVTGTLDEATCCVPEHVEFKKTERLVTTQPINMEIKWKNFAKDPGYCEKMGLYGASTTINNAVFANDDAARYSNWAKDGANSYPLKVGGDKENALKPGVTIEKVKFIANQDFAGTKKQEPAIKAKFTITQGDEKAKKCDYEVTFTKDEKEDIICAHGEYAGAAQCEKCHESCETCWSGANAAGGANCRTCKDGLGQPENYVGAQICKPCEAGTVLDKGTCKKCPDGCAKCGIADKTKCEQCKEGFDLQADKTCKENANAKKCTTEGEILVGTECKKCDGDRCKKCKDADKCEVCKDDFKLESDKCKPKNPVTECKGEGEWLVDGACHKCAENCKKCKSADKCETCKDEFTVEEEGKTCKKKEEQKKGGLHPGVIVLIVIIILAIIGGVGYWYYTTTKAKKLQEQLISNDDTAVKLY